jgi:hypothetical protein
MVSTINGGEEATELTVIYRDIPQADRRPDNDLAHLLLTSHRQST